MMITIMANYYYYYTSLTASSRTAWVSRYQKGKTSPDSDEARDDGFLGWQWHQLEQMIDGQDLRGKRHFNARSA